MTLTEIKYTTQFFKVAKFPINIKHTLILAL